MVKRVRKLTPEQRKAVWAGPTSNAGVGWKSGGYHSPDETPQQQPREFHRTGQLRGVDEILSDE